MAKPNPFNNIISELKVDDKTYRYYDLAKLNDPRVKELPYSIRLLLESCIRNCDEFDVTKKDVETLLNWKQTSTKSVEIPFKPARVLMQDFTGVPAVVDLAAMRDSVKRLGGDPIKVNPVVPAELVVDHSVQVDVARNKDALEKNQIREMERNRERFQFLNWGQKAFKNTLIVPPGSGIVHQVNLEYLARVVFNNNGMLYPDSCVGTDSHTTMVDALGVAGWGVGGIEAEAVMLGQSTVMVIPPVVGFRFVGHLDKAITATDLVLTVTEILRKKDVVGKFVEFFGPSVSELSLEDRATVANMAPEYGATMGFFPIDATTISYCNLTGRDSKLVESYFKSNLMFVEKESKETPSYSEVIEFDLSSIVPSISGPKRPQDRVPVSEVKDRFNNGLSAKVGFSGYGLKPEVVDKAVPFTFDGKEYLMKHGTIVIAAITSCTNTSNPSSMIAAGLLARNAVKLGLETPAFIKTSLGPGSQIVTKYLQETALLEYLEKLGFNVVGYGCTTCIGNSGEIPPPVSEAIDKNDIVACAVLSGNRNFEGRVHEFTRANWLASPPLVVAYALAGRININFDTEPIANVNGKDLFLKDIWPKKEEIDTLLSTRITSSMFKESYKTVTQGTPQWQELKTTDALLYPWDKTSTYINEPPFFQNMPLEPPAAFGDIKDAYCLLNLGDSITTDHISPAGNIKSGPASEWLKSKGVEKRNFNTFGARRGHDEVMARGTFFNARLVNKLVPKPGSSTIYVPTNEEVSVYEASRRYREQNSPLIVLGGALYGSGSSRDWAAKGPYLLGIKAVIAKTYERIHRSNLIGMGMIPLQFKPGEDADTLGLTGKETFSIDLTSKPLAVGMDVTVTVSTGKTFTVKLRADTLVELEYIRHGGILRYVIRQMIKT